MDRTFFFTAFTRFIFAAMGCLLIGLGPILVAQETAVVAVSGDVPLGFTDSLFEIDAAILSNSGEVCFSGTLRENGRFKSSGLFIGSGDRSKISAVVLLGDPTPDSNGNVGPIGSSGFQINRQGQVAGLLSLTGTLGGSTDNAGLYLIDPADRSLTEIARKGETILDSESETFVRTPASYSLNSAGQLVFSSTIFNNAEGFFGSAVHLYENGVETELLRSGQTTPDDQGIFSTLGLGTVPRLNQVGQVVVNAGITPNDPRGSRAGIFLITDDNTTTVALENQEVPDGNGNLSGLQLTSPTIGNGGHVAFWSRLKNTTGGAVDNAAIFRSDGTDLAEIARRGSLVADGNGRYLNLHSLAEVNRAGEVVFYSTITGASEGSDAGIFAGDDTTHRTVVRIGDTLPSGDEVASIVEESIAFNDLGQVFFAAVLKLADPLAPANTIGLFLHDPKAGLLEVAREKESVGDLGVITQLLPNLRSSSSATGSGSLNEKGQVVYRAFIGGNAVVLRWSPPAGILPTPLPTPDLVSTGDELILQWPKADPNIVVESTTDLRNPTSWRRRSEILPEPKGTIFEATIPTAKTREFFRLRRE